MLQAPVSFCNKGLLLLQVPENLPSFFTNNLMAMPAKAMANRTIESKMTFMLKFMNNYSVDVILNKIQAGRQTSTGIHPHPTYLTV